MSTESNSTDPTERRGDRESEAGSHAAEDPSLPESQLTEDEALSELQQADISAHQIVAISKNAAAAKSHKVAMAIVMHPRAPRHVSVPLLRRMFTFDLMKVSLTPAIAADIKRAAEDQILLRVESLPLGEKITLAKRASGRTAAALLQENDRWVIEAALDNAQLTEALVVQALMKPLAPVSLFVLGCGHAKWSLRHEVQIALLRSEKTPLERARELAKAFSSEFLRETLDEHRLAQLL